MQQSPSSPPPAAAAFSASPQDRTNAALQHVRTYPVGMSDAADTGCYFMDQADLHRARLEGRD